MAAEQHTPRRARVRKRRMQRIGWKASQRQELPRRQRIAHDKAVPAKAPDAGDLHEALTDHIHGLELAMSAVIVSVSALRRQNSDIDEDIARVLERSAADRLDVEIEKLQTLTNQGGAS